MYASHTKICLKYSNVPHTNFFFPSALELFSSKMFFSSRSHKVNKRMKEKNRFGNIVRERSHVYVLVTDYTFIHSVKLTFSNDFFFLLKNVCRLAFN